MRFHQTATVSASMRDTIDAAMRDALVASNRFESATDRREIIRAAATIVHAHTLTPGTADLTTAARTHERAARAAIRRLTPGEHATLFNAPMTRGAATVVRAWLDGHRVTVPAPTRKRRPSAPAPSPVTVRYVEPCA